MLRWIFGGREAQSSAEKSGVLRIGEEQPKNRFTELQVLKGHFDIVRFLVQIDDFRCASAGDDGLVLVWNVETGERVQELRGHSRQITAMAVFRRGDVRLVTASSDRSVALWDPDTGNRVQTVLDLQSSVKCILVLERLSAWISAGEELCVWSKDFRLECLKEPHSDTGISSLIELPKNRVAAAVDRSIVIYKLMPCGDTLSVVEVSCLADHRDHIRALVNVNDGMFASGSHAGELILWDALDCGALAYRHISREEPQTGTQSHVGGPKPSEMSIRHLASDGNLVAAAAGSGVYVFSAATGAAVAYRKRAHDSDVLHTALLSDRSAEPKRVTSAVLFLRLLLRLSRQRADVVLGGRQREDVGHSRASVSRRTRLPRLLRDVDLGAFQQADVSCVQEDAGPARHQDAGVDGRPHRTLGCSPDVLGLPGERPGDVFGRPPAHPVEERREAVATAQPGALPETGGERRTLKGGTSFCNVCPNKRCRRDEGRTSGFKCCSRAGMKLECCAVKSQIVISFHSMQPRLNLVVRLQCSTTLCHNIPGQH
ncbi:WD repeat-containing protein 41 isoform X2 [Phycodurus eques]|uniref:WD repeat-containing protein 41 isoform X2 n=1 Tax=Phycodurus eques TaxID=693459 RepID=UPI002ACD8C25|nr:WD repeat-containing protein 41 isoform X2 [Phycodurus eques]